MLIHCKFDSTFTQLFDTFTFVACLRWSMRPGTGREAMLTARPGALDSSSIIDLLDKRMNELEGRLKDGTSGPVGNHSHSINKHHMSHRDETEHDWSRRKGLALGDMEYALQEMQLQLNAQSNMLESLSSRYEDFSSSRRLAATASDDSAHSLKDLKKRVKTVTNEVEDLARSNKEFSGHLRELVDQIISWSDHVHSCFGLVSHKLGFPNNICSKIRMNTVINRVHGTSSF
jgi:hypothetical protein